MVHWIGVTIEKAQQRLTWVIWGRDGWCASGAGSSCHQLSALPIRQTGSWKPVVHFWLPHRAVPVHNTPLQRSSKALVYKLPWKTTLHEIAGAAIKMDICEFFHFFYGRCKDRSRRFHRVATIFSFKSLEKRGSATDKHFKGKTYSSKMVHMLNSCVQFSCNCWKRAAAKHTVPYIQIRAEQHLLSSHRRSFNATLIRNNNPKRPKQQHMKTMRIGSIYRLLQKLLL